MRTCFLLLLVLLNSFAYTQTPLKNTEWKIKSSNITFKIKNAGFNVDGSFGLVTANIIFDVENKEGNTINASFKSSTLNTGNKTRDNHLKKEEYFNVEQFPEISIISTSIKHIKGENYIGTYKLTIKNITKEITIPFTFNEIDSSGIFKGTFTLNRLNYNIGSSSFVLSDNVTVDVELKVKRK